ncbi:transcription initiation factor TFIID subunit 9 [Nilaparvata lugens]|uniref:transcription initiation factor TFIID subunit 9 n=1 Tax=Nilaparvata lugens TaxID=108931 RepID=UPI00193D8010|nr:transcription initiation factor TFIID subunit 9 [Nilaparvata lugens]
MAKAMDNNKAMPSSQRAIISILEEMGITEYDPRVTNQLLEFVHRYVTSVLDDARVYANHAKKKNIDLEDVKLATTLQQDRIFTSPPSRDVLLELAREKNRTPLPTFDELKNGIRLPHDRYCLNSCNYRVKSSNPYQNSKYTTPTGLFEDRRHRSVRGNHMAGGAPFASKSSLNFLRQSRPTPRTETITSAKSSFQSSTAGAQGASINPNQKMQINTWGPTIPVELNVLRQYKNKKLIPSTSGMQDMKLIPNTSGIPHKRAFPSTSGMQNLKLIPSTSGITNMRAIQVLVECKI